MVMSKQRPNPDQMHIFLKTLGVDNCQFQSHMENTLPSSRRNPVPNCVTIESQSSSQSRFNKYVCSILCPFCKVRQPRVCPTSHTLTSPISMISTAPTFDVSNLLDQHKTVMTGGGSVIKHCTSVFAANASVAYIPTGVVATGPIRKLSYHLPFLSFNYF